MDEITFNGPVKAHVQAIGAGAQANKTDGTPPPLHALPPRQGQNASSKINFNNSVTADVQVIGSGAQANAPLQSQPALQQETINVLFALSSPRGYEILRLNEEIRIIEQVLERSKHRDQIRRHILHATTSNDLQHELQTSSYQILHLAGHAVSDGFILENEQGHPHKVSREALAAYLNNYRETLRCVVLNACYSLSLGESLALGIPHVICVNGEIRDPAAIAFARGFYDAIGAGYDAERAYNEGLGAVRFAGLDHKLLVLLDKGRAS